MCMLMAYTYFLLRNTWQIPQHFVDSLTISRYSRNWLFWLENLHDKNVKHGEKVANKQLESYKIKHNENEATQLAGN